MDEKTAYTERGYVLIARKILVSPVWRNGDYRGIWLWLLIRANWENGRPCPGLPRGSLYVSFPDIEKAVPGVTSDQWKKFLAFATEAQMLTSTKQPHGTLIKILNYGKLQEPATYRDTTPRRKGGATSATAREEYVRELEEQLWELRFNGESYKRMCAAAHDKFKDYGRNGAGKTIVEEAMARVVARKKQGGAHP